MAFFWRIFCGHDGCWRRGEEDIQKQQAGKNLLLNMTAMGVPLCAESQTRRYNAALPVSPRLCPILE